MLVESFVFFQVQEELTRGWIPVSHPHFPGPAVTTEEPPQQNVENNMIEEETTPSVELVPSEPTTTVSFEGNEVQESHANQRAGNNSKDTAKGSSSSWIVAMVAILSKFFFGAQGVNFGHFLHCVT